MQETAKRIFSVHSVLLGRGFALSSPPTVSQALDGVLPFRLLYEESTKEHDVVLELFRIITLAFGVGAAYRNMRSSSSANPHLIRVLFFESILRKVEHSLSPLSSLSSLWSREYLSDFNMVS
ncbi:E3 ubiquitin-protein ligase [Vespula maculifrons]|uniref:E3 ubiquitin-protein ligase n=1 Tax=Vespula maculifrons TaxID=7453 RepID=A0ABD2CNQ2_VESMC